ncbi:coat protein [Anagyris vein yellowing virus]|uniref:Capsid protein n=1 Tax=Anagyris vein yellowing virus TaxID=312275 RepID=Q3BD92_9VIRU|nr:coat protein [Anagyris vein yellowing virus]AAW88530.1 coat protein [Anagyris vein yellowing virus]
MDEVKPISAPQPSIPAEGSHLVNPKSAVEPHIILPFQISAAEFGVRETSVQITLSSDPTISTYTALYRHAQLVECEAILFPNFTSSSNPTHCDIIWVPSNSTASPKTILQTYGGSRYTLGGPITSNQTISVPLPLRSVNCMVKDSVLYTDTPRLLAFSPAPLKPSSVPSGTLLVRGRVKLSSPLPQPSG